MRNNTPKNESMFGNATKLIFEYAKELRINMTEAENLLWIKLENKQFHGYKFRRQHPFDSFILDFYCHKARLAIEVDGSVHDSKEQQEYDVQRNVSLELTGIKTLRFKNEQIQENIEKVLDEIYIELYQETPNK